MNFGNTTGCQQADDGQRRGAIINRNLAPSVISNVISIKLRYVRNSKSGKNGKN
jgi:hypothetical protein